jgi:hypothetical protein
MAEVACRRYNLIVGGYFFSDAGDFENFFLYRWRNYLNLRSERNRGHWPHFLTVDNSRQWDRLPSPAYPLNHQRYSLAKKKFASDTR